MPHKRPTCRACHTKDQLTAHAFQKFHPRSTTSNKWHTDAAIRRRHRHACRSIVANPLLVTGKETPAAGTAAATATCIAVHSPATAIAVFANAFPTAYAGAMDIAALDAIAAIWVTGAAATSVAPPMLPLCRRLQPPPTHKLHVVAIVLRIWIGATDPKWPCYCARVERHTRLLRCVFARPVQTERAVEAFVCALPALKHAAAVVAATAVTAADVAALATAGTDAAAVAVVCAVQALPAFADADADILAAAGAAGADAADAVIAAAAAIAAAARGAAVVDTAAGADNDDDAAAAAAAAAAADAIRSTHW
eukprot:365635-Chlamydomonas_euryale.AAC.6